MSQVWLYGLLSVSPLILGSLLGTRFKLSRRLQAVILAFAAGTFISALAFDLFAESFGNSGVLVTSVGFLAGAAVYITLNQIVGRRAKRASRGGLLLALGAGLDGVPENVALGTTLALGTGSPALLAAIMVSNLPEALVSTEELRQGGRSIRFILSLWLLVAIILVPFVFIGSLLTDVNSPLLAFIQSFAAGAVLGLVADNMLPEAYEEGGPWVAFVTAAGFLMAFMLDKL